MTGFSSTLATIWRLASPYFRSEDRWRGFGLLAGVIALELGTVGINVILNKWYARFYNALQDYNWDAFVSGLLFFSVAAGSFVVFRAYQQYLNMWLQIRWRRWMTARYLGQWIDAANHYRMQLLGDAADNPDQRIAEDIKQFVEQTLMIAVNVLGSVVSLASFVVILWGLSDEAPLTLFGLDSTIPGYLVWAALIYATLGTLLAHLIGRALIALNFNQQRYEADFRFNLVRVRENSEQVALLHGDAAEQQRLMDRFGAVVANFLRIMTRTKNLIFFVNGFGQAAVVLPYLLVSPAYFARRIALGGLVQTASAFNSVQEALSVFVTIYRQLAEWRAVIERLAGFELAIAGGQSAARTPPVITVVAQDRSPTVRADALEVKLPTGAPLLSVGGVAFAPGERVLVTGPSGAGKSTLFRALGGIWPFGSGIITVPDGKRVMVLPQRPYFPIGSLAAAVAYPAVPGTFNAQYLAEVLVAVGLPGLVPRLAEEAHWNRMLSLGEQQRLGIARAILHAPSYLFLDEATASLDEPTEAALYRLLHERLKDATIVSIGHRSTLRAFHRRHLTLARDGDRHRLREIKLEAAE